jgi:energy-coupling factor transporter transmembrane protein EcfT
MLLASSGFFTLLLVAVWLYALFDALTSPEDKIRRLQKPLWILAILLLFALGAFLWFAFGRPRSTRPIGFGGGFPGSAGRSHRPGPIAPDDDPDFLRGLNRPRDGNDPSKPA